MNKKKIMVLLVLLVAVVGFTMASVSAASTQSKTFTVKDNSIVTKSISKVKVYLKNKNKKTVVRTYNTAAGGKIIKVSSKETPYKVVVYYKTYKNKIVY